VGGILIPIAAVFDPRVRTNRLSLFLPPPALMPAAIVALALKAADLLLQNGYGKLLQRPSETIETYLYFFILAYLIVFARRIGEIEASEA